MYNWVRNHPCETSGAGATFTTTFDRSWSGNRLRQFWDQRNRKERLLSVSKPCDAREGRPLICSVLKAAKSSRLELMPCQRFIRNGTTPPLPKASMESARHPCYPFTTLFTLFTYFLRPVRHAFNPNARWWWCSLSTMQCRTCTTVWLHR